MLTYEEIYLQLCKNVRGVLTYVTYYSITLQPIQGSIHSKKAHCEEGVIQMMSETMVRKQGCIIETLCHRSHPPPSK